MREYTPWDYVKPGIAIAAFAVGLIFVLFKFDAVSKVGGVLFNAVSSFILGLFIAYILNVFLNLFENTVFGRLTRSDNKVWKKLKRPVCVALSYAVIVLILLAITLYVVPEIFKSLELIGETARVNIPVYVDQIAKWTDELSKQFDFDFSTMVDSLNNFNWSSILSGATEFTTNFFSSLVNVTVNVASGIFTFVLSVIFSAYFLTSKESLLLSLKRVSYSLLPKKVVATLADIAVTSNNVFSSFVRGQLTECVILGCLCFICMSLIGFDYALLISCIVTITALIPILGAYIGCGIGAFLLLIVNPMDAVWFVIFFICLQQFEGNLIYPKLVRSPLGLPPILGIILGTPIAAVLYTVMRRVTTNRLAARGLSNADLEPGKYPYLENSHYAAGYSKGRPLCAPVLERAAKKKEQGKKPLFLKFKTSKKK